jgi:hypothetical protein
MDEKVKLTWKIDGEELWHTWQSDLEGVRASALNYGVELNDNIMVGVKTPDEPRFIFDIVSPDQGFYIADKADWHEMRKNLLKTIESAFDQWREKVGMILNFTKSSQ